MGSPHNRQTDRRQTIERRAPGPVAAIQRALLAWFEKNRRALPWRATRDPYAIWVSEVMLQQTQVATVIPYFHRFLARFPSVTALAKADEQAVLKVWEGLGYYARARNLRRAAQEVVQQHQGRVPRHYDALLALPGIGAYVAAAVASIAAGVPRAAVDGNVKRVLARLNCLTAPVNDSTAHAIYAAAATELLDVAHPGSFNEAMMELGALVCRPKQPLCDHCPLQRHCCAFRAGRVVELPQRRPRKSRPTRHQVAGVLFWRGRVLIRRRQEERLLRGLWELPSAPVTARANPARVCGALFRRSFGLPVEVDSLLTHVRHAYTHFTLELDAFECRCRGGATGGLRNRGVRWVWPGQLSRYPFSGAHRKVLARVLAGR